MILMFYRKLFVYAGVLIFLFILALTSCNNKTQDQSSQKNNKRQAKERALIEANRSAIETEKEMIEAYARRYNWTLQSASGVYFTRYRKGSGPEISAGDRVTYHYKLSLINGEEISGSKQGHPEVMRVAGGGSQVSGLHRGMTNLREGDKAKLIVPSHLAYGIAGDQDKIPPKTTLIYDLEILEVRKGEL
jgi:FKBP-type peptidyl-prolyl cis-trans isomerase